MLNKMPTLSDRKHAVKKLTSIVNDSALLDEISKNSYKRKDTSASWIGPFIPETTNNSYLSFNNVSVTSLKNWAKEHWMIYESFIDQFCNKEGDILDVGCGSGNTTALLSMVFPYNEIVGIDMDKSTVRFAKKFNQYNNIQYRHTSLENCSEELYDYVFVCEVLEHMKYDKQIFFVEKCLSLLKKDGFVFLTTPNSINEKIGGHHIGLLNEHEFQIFYDHFKTKITNFSFIDNKKLASCESGIEAIINDPVETFNKQDVNRSHFRLAMQNI